MVQHRVYTYYIEVYKLAVTSIFKVPQFSQKDHNGNDFLSWVRHSVPHSWQKFHCYCGLFVKMARLWKLTLRRVCILLCNKCLLGAETHCRLDHESAKIKLRDLKKSQKREKKVTAEKNPYTVLPLLFFFLFFLFVYLAVCSFLTRSCITITRLGISIA